MVVVKGYKLGEALGEGAFATCRLGHKESDPKCTVAVKSLMRNHPNFDEDSLRKEIHIMQAIKHPRCIALYEVIEDSAAVHLVEELASGGELFDRIIELGHFSETQAVKLIHQVFDGIQYLHTNGMIHRDLKPENLLMVSRDPNSEEFMQLKIADFGLSAQRTEAKSAEEWEKMLQDFCGTQDYLAPEVFTLAATRNKVIDFFKEWT
jgi:serine/threonine protein kinase